MVIPCGSHPWWKHIPINLVIQRPPLMTPSTLVLSPTRALVPLLPILWSMAFMGLSPLDTGYSPYLPSVLFTGPGLANIGNMAPRSADPARFWARNGLPIARNALAPQPGWHM